VNGKWRPQGRSGAWKRNKGGPGTMRRGGEHGWGPAPVVTRARRRQAVGGGSWQGIRMEQLTSGPESQCHGLN
jgi:hypothetical protein